MWRDGRAVLLGCFLSALSGFPGAAARAADLPAEATLRGCLERAFTANPELRAFERRYRAALERVPQAAALPDPMLQVTHFVEAMQTDMGPQRQEIMFSQQIPWFGTLGRRADVAAAEAEAAWYAFQDRQLTLAREVAWAYFEYGYNARAMELAGQNLRLLEELVATAQEKVRSGGDLNQLLRLQIETGRMQDRVRTLEEERRAQSARLAGLLALPADDLLPAPAWEAPGEVAVDEADLVRALEAGNPELAMLERRIASADAARELARLAGRPDFTVGLSYMTMGDPIDPGMAADRDPWGVTLGLNLPIWRGKYRAQRREAAVLHEVAQREREHRLNVLRAELAASLARLRDAHRRLRLYGEDLLGLARQALDLSRSAYEGGREGILDLIDSERNLLDLQLEYWRAAADAWQQRVTIQTLTNQPLAGAVIPPGKP